MKVPDFIAEFQSRSLGILWDDATSPSRGILVLPAQKAEPSTVNELISLSGGIVFVALSPDRCQKFLLPPLERPRMEAPDAPQLSQPYLSVMLSVEAREGVHSGISAADRAVTIRVLGEKDPQPQQLVSPGHIFPVLVRAGGVLMKQALPEGALDLVTLAGFSDAAAFADVVGSEGQLLGRSGLWRLARDHGIPMLGLSTLVRYRLEHERLVQRYAEARLPTQAAGELRSVVYRSQIYEGDHLALIKGEINPKEPTLVRVQSEFTCGDVFGGRTPPTRTQLNASLTEIGKEGRGVLVYLRSPEPDQLTLQVKQWEAGFARKPASMIREYGIGAQILRDLDVSKVVLLTASSKSMVGLKAFGLEIVSQRALPEGGENRGSPLGF